MAKDIKDFRQYIEKFKSLANFGSLFIGSILYKLYIQDLNFEEIATLIISNDKIDHLTENSRSSIIGEISKVYDKAEFLKKSIDFYWQKIKIFAETELFSFDFDMDAPKPSKAKKRKVDDPSTSSMPDRTLGPSTTVNTAYRRGATKRVVRLLAKKAAIQSKIKCTSHKIKMLKLEMQKSEAVILAAVRDAKVRDGLILEEARKLMKTGNV